MGHLVVCWSRCWDGTGGQGCCNISCLGTRSILLSTSARPWFGSCWLGCRRAGHNGAAVVSPKRVDTTHRSTSGAGIWNPTDPSASVALMTLKLGSPAKQKSLLHPSSSSHQALLRDALCPSEVPRLQQKAPRAPCWVRASRWDCSWGQERGSRRRGSDLAPPTLCPVTLLASDLGCCRLHMRLGRAAAHEVMSP